MQQLSSVAFCKDKIYPFIDAYAFEQEFLLDRTSLDASPRLRTV
jgi:hypothetical protein